jgi:hypothetical protein
MISLAEKTGSINVKDLSFSEPKPSMRIRPVLNFVGGFRGARQLFEQIPSLPTSLAEAVRSFAGKDIAVVANCRAGWDRK